MKQLFTIGFLFSFAMSFYSILNAIKERETKKAIANWMIVAYAVGTAALYAYEALK